MAEPVRVPVVTQTNEPAGELELPQELAGGPVRRHLLYEIVRMQRANRRAGTAATKTRGAVSGGGKKPWKQKGTGRARAGSTRSPLWAGGATLFGPQPRNYAYRLPGSARRAALRSVLTLKAREGRLFVLDKIQVDQPKTKEVVKMMSTMGASSAVIITAEVNENLEKAARNLPNVKVLRAAGANVYDILRFQHLLIARDAVDVLGGRLAT